MPKTLTELQKMALEKVLDRDQQLMAISVTSCDHHSCNGKVEAAEEAVQPVQPG